MIGCLYDCVIPGRFYDWVLLRLYDCVLLVHLYNWVLYSCMIV